jgi:hypothetical protein
MTAPADVLAVLRNRVAEVESKWGHPEGADLHGREAIDAVAELIAACHERDASREASLAATKARLEARRAGLPEPDSRAAYLAASDADERYFSALAACKPATGAEK